MTAETKTLSLAQLKAKCVDCAGCRDNFYNHPEAARPGEGTSPTGFCWSLPKAKMRWRWAINMQTPMDTRDRFRRIKVYDCYHGNGPYRDIYMSRLPAHLGSDWADKTEEREQTPQQANAAGM